MKKTKKTKPKEIKFQDFQVSVMGFSNQPGVGYVRFATPHPWGGETYYGSINWDERLSKLRALSNAINAMIRQQTKKKKAAK